jgi:hypothetical protein
MTLTTAPSRAGLLAAGASILACAVAGPAGAQSARFSTRTLTEPANPGLAVTGPLSDLVATSRARVVVPLAWQRRDAPAGRLRFQTQSNPGCRYTVSYAVTTVLAPPADVADRVADRLPAAGPRYVLDSGERGNRAFRVVRRKSSGGQVRVDALWSGVLTRRADVAPGGQVAWTEVRVAAVSRAGDECHAGTWREALGPAIGDSLAVARTTLHFTKQRS